ncbi:hypothetical protein [Pseudomonas putida]|uniref:hypothetical protein n=1 Tax=Pseudomonas putida TaxID=303 RepID=UPI00236518CF|nr:hypothetical protein [Pseudomonas putida]MDD2045949.1 hypothetical protein [Pseudomonas putida]
MKLTFKMSGLVAAAIFSTVTAAATEYTKNIQIDNESSPLLLAEGGSDRVMEYHLQNSLANNKPDQPSGERYVQMLKEQPTASGTNPTGESLQQTTDPEPNLTSPINRDREEYRSAH